MSIEPDHYPLIYWFFGGAAQTDRFLLNVNRRAAEKPTHLHPRTCCFELRGSGGEETVKNLSLQFVGGSLNLLFRP